MQRCCLKRRQSDALERGRGDGNNGHSHGTWLCVSGRCHRLVHTPGAVRAFVDHAGSDFFIKSVEEALARHGEPDIFNTGQGSQFTSIAFTPVLKDA